ncbi:MAG TPA: ATP-binding protein [Bryobacteraceae bacterium]|nr:ATP-binding protein [Bryobacteraceae bacterium]
MRNLRDIPIGQKLMIIIMVTTTSALLLASLGIVFADSLLFRGYLRRDLSALTRIIADNSTAALAFDDPKSASETLAALRARPHVIGACIYRLNATILANYSRQNSFACPPPEIESAIRFTSDRLTVAAPVLLNGSRIGSLLLVYDLGEIYDRIVLYGGTVLGVLLASSALALLLSSRLRAVIATPISQLVSATTSVAQTGDYRIRAQRFSNDELGTLVDRFNEMLAGIQSRDDDLKKALLERELALMEVERERERFHFMAESMPQKIFTARPNGSIDYFNQQWALFTGLSLDQIAALGWTQFIHPDDREESARGWQDAISSGEPFHCEHRFRRADGVYRWHLTRALAMRDATAGISLWIASSTEIHQQKEKEDELRRANDDLQQFAYSASHDLQEPIRNVAVYSDLVAKKYHNVLDADGQQFLGFLQEGGRRLATLINDLLAYTRAGMAQVVEAPVSATSVFEHTLASLAEAIRESDAVVTSDVLPEVFMGESHLQQVFQNLIGNALKYRSEDAPRIHVSAGKRGAAWLFSVRDNGIGIDPRYKEKIFGVFKRLHHDHKYGGTGIGLAICQRVVERYGGRIWVESEPGQGATFFFTVPQSAQRVRSSAAESSAG